MISCAVIEFYKSHSVRDTLKEFKITYKQLKSICSQYNFVKSKEQIRNTYKTTKIKKYGSLQNAYEESYKNKLKTINRRYGSIELYDEVRTLNSCKTCRKNSGFSYPMQNPETVKKANKSKKGK